MADTNTRTRRTPTLSDTFEGEIPQSSRNGFWVNEVVKIKASPEKVFAYENVSPTAASNLRKTYGLNAHTRTVTDAEGNKRPVLYVTWDADKADEIKAAVAARGEKRKAAQAAKGNKPAGQTAKAPK